ncbi:zinc finger BED domain-containing protein 4-like [Aphis craccivora]|uniref:Zinc finger BED domain-containing protein 4-like n=1 Tax=Aphis craccivora TaxID=307492 RepID=A0A6G0YW68_APHCR|nr:zinc finger BED domain-containing protein 4-like [Aphis craccivora]
MDIQMKSYIGLTIHFLEGNKFKSGTLGVHELSTSHTSEHIGESFESVLSQWEINHNQIIAIVTDNGIPEGKILKLILDVKTRLNSLYYMLERFLHLYRIISSILLERSGAPDMITTRELQVFEEVKLLMQPLEDLTNKISGEKFAIISTILPLINCTTNANLHFKDPVRCQRAIDILKQILILKENSENVASTEPHTNNLTANKPSDSFDLWSYHTSVATEQSVYPNLYQIARQKLSIVSTSVPSERLYSKTGQIISKARNRLTGIPGNEKADTLANEAITSISSTSISTLPYQDIKRTINTHTTNMWQKSWDEIPMSNKLKSIKKKVTKWHLQLNIPRRSEVINTRTRIGHTNLTHIHIIKHEEHPLCSQCNVPLSIKHIVLDCPLHVISRIILNQPTSMEDALGEHNTHLIHSFFKNIGIDTKI